MTKRFLSLFLITVLCAGLLACAQPAFKQVTAPAAGPGLTLTAAKDVMVILYSGFINDDTVVAPAQITDEGDLRHYYYPDALASAEVKVTSTINYNYIGGNGYKLVLGEGLNCITNSKGAYFNLCGGSYGAPYKAIMTDWNIDQLLQ